MNARFTPTLLEANSPAVRAKTHGPERRVFSQFMATCHEVHVTFEAALLAHFDLSQRRSHSNPPLLVTIVAKSKKYSEGWTTAYLAAHRINQNINRARPAGRHHERDAVVMRTRFYKKEAAANQSGESRP